MGTIKFVNPSDWNFDCPIMSVVKIASDGKLHDFDKKEFIKRASGSENVFLKYIDNVKFAKDEVPVHMIALGALEAYGPNRNGDGFSEEALKRYHKTFEKFAKLYRNHKNKDPNESYGVVKLATYNNKMKRVELLVALNGSEAAARRNKGLVADKELQKLARDEDFAVSMACRVPYDKCSYCGNIARTRDEYCTMEKCAAGGCKENLSKVVKVGNDLHHLFVYNDHPTFFDISHVFRPADRIAWATKADWIKTAHDQWNELLTSKNSISEHKHNKYFPYVPLSVIEFENSIGPVHYYPFISDQIKIAHALADIDSDEKFRYPQIIKLAFHTKVKDKIDFEKLGAYPIISKAAQALAALADEKIIIDLYDFCKLNNVPHLYKAAKANMKGIYGKMIDEGMLDYELINNYFNVYGHNPTEQQKAYARMLAPGYSFDKKAVDYRLKLASLKGLTPDDIPDYKTIVKQANYADPNEIESLIKKYACYQISALHRISKFDKNIYDLARLTIQQNYI